MRRRLDVNVLDDLLMILVTLAKMDNKSFPMLDHFSWFFHLIYLKCVIKKLREHNLTMLQPDLITYHKYRSTLPDNSLVTANQHNLNYEVCMKRCCLVYFVISFRLTILIE